MTDIAIIPATEDHARQIAPRLLLRHSICQIWESLGQSPEKAAVLSVQSSPICRTAIVDGEIAAIGGLAVRSIVSAVAMPWLLPTELIMQHKVAFFRRSREFILEGSEIYSSLSGIVEGTHTDSIKWLSWLGFKIGGAEFNSALGAEMRRFEMVR